MIVGTFKFQERKAINSTTADKRIRFFKYGNLASKLGEIGNQLLSNISIITVDRHRDRLSTMSRSLPVAGLVLVHITLSIPIPFCPLSKDT